MGNAKTLNRDAGVQLFRGYLNQHANACLADCWREAEILAEWIGRMAASIRRDQCRIYNFFTLPVPAETEPCELIS